MAFVTHAYRLVVKIETWLQPAVLLLIRVAFGYQFMLTGYGKLTHIDMTIENFTKWGVPMPHVNAYMAGATEMVCGTLLLLGLGGRLISIPLVFTMLVAYATAHRDSIVEIFAPTPYRDGHYDDLLERVRNMFDQAAFPFLCAALVVMVFGSGKWSIDAIIRKIIGDPPPEKTAQGFPIH